MPACQAQSAAKSWSKANQNRPRGCHIENAYIIFENRWKIVQTLKNYILCYVHQKIANNMSMDS
jgi:hypothetical protein